MSESVVDWKTLEANFDGDPFAISLVVDAFLSSVEEMLIKLRVAIDAHNSKSIAMAAHSLKGAMANFGARDAVAFAQQLEDHGYQGIDGREAQILSALEMAVVELVDELRAKSAA